MFFTDVFFIAVALAMDAFAVSVATGISQSGINRRRSVALSGTFGAFQMIMPMIGWLIVSVSVRLVSVIEKAVPWIAAAVLILLGIKMICESFKQDGGETAVKPGIAGALYAALMTSIDALSVGPTMAEMSFLYVLTESAVIGIVTFAVCLAGFFAGRKIGGIAERRSGLIGGIILILVGIRFFIGGVILH